MRCGGPGRERGWLLGAPGHCFWLWLRGSDCVEKRLYRSRGLCCGRACGGSFKGWGASCWQAGLLRSAVGCGGLAAQGPAAPGLVWVWGGSQGVQLLRAMQCLLQAVSSHRPWAVVCWTLGAERRVLGFSSEGQLCSSFLLSVFLVLCVLQSVCLSLFPPGSLAGWASTQAGLSLHGLGCADWTVQGRIQDTSPGHSERTFIKAGDSASKEGLRAEAARLRGQ